MPCPVLPYAEPSIPCYYCDGVCGYRATLAWYQKRHSARHALRGVQYWASVWCYALGTEWVC
eukprot:3272852-Rhodomonas_salina.1